MAEEPEVRREDEDKLLDHDYDGIKELDNNLPNWWLWLFYVTIIWGFLYLIYYHVLGIGYSSHEEYMVEMDPNYVRETARDPKLLGLLPEYKSPYFNPRPDPTPWSKALGTAVVYQEETRETDTVQYVALVDQADLTAGQEIFLKNCATCHGKQGQGGIGPNLTDQYWLHGASFNDLVKSVKYGFPAKGMIAWRGFLKPDEILQVASYVETLKGTNPPNPKAPQGELVEATE